MWAETDGNTFPRANATPLANAGRASAPEGTLSLHAKMKQQRRGFNEILKSPPGAFASHFDLEGEAHLRRPFVLVPFALRLATQQEQELRPSVRASASILL